MWEVPAEFLLQAEWLGVLPLVTLTDGGKRPEVVKEMIDQLVSAEEYDLLAIAQVLGGLVFKTGPELAWFRKRFSMFQDILSESRVYQEIAEQGVEKGRIQGQQEMLLKLIQLRFPELEALAKQQTEGITDPELLPPVNFKLLAAQTVEAARQILLNLDKDGTRH